MDNKELVRRVLSLANAAYSRQTEGDEVEAKNLLKGLRGLLNQEITEKKEAISDQKDQESQ